MFLRGSEQPTGPLIGVTPEVFPDPNIRSIRQPIGLQINTALTCLHDVVNSPEAREAADALADAAQAPEGKAPVVVTQNIAALISGLRFNLGCRTPEVVHDLRLLAGALLARFPKSIAVRSLGIFADRITPSSNLPA